MQIQLFLFWLQFRMIWYHFFFLFEKVIDIFVALGAVSDNTYVSPSPSQVSAVQDGTDYAQIPEVLVLADDMLDAEGVRGVVLVGGGLHAGRWQEQTSTSLLQATFTICCWLFHAISLWSISWLQWKELWAFRLLTWVSYTCLPFLIRKLEHFHKTIHRECVAKH